MNDPDARAIFARRLIAAVRRLSGNRQSHTAWAIAG